MHGLTWCRGTFEMSASTDQDTRRIVERRIEAGREAMTAIADYDQQQADELARAAAWAIYQEDHAEALIETTLEATGIGDPADKRAKLRRRVKGILHDALGEQTVGMLSTDRDGVVELAKPVGVVGGLVPSTNPAPTVANLAILAVKGRNALVISASPAGLAPAAEAVEYIRRELSRVGAPRDLVQVLPRPASKAKAQALLEAADLVQVTGSSDNVAAGETAGTPNYCVSAGNPVALVDPDVDLERVAGHLVESAAYDNGAACVAESCVVVPAGSYSALRDAVAAEGAYLCTAAETARIRETLCPDGDLNRAVVGRDAGTLAGAAGIDATAARDAALLVVEPDDIVRDPLVTECLAPVVATIDVPSFEAGLETANRILDREGAGHSVAVHTPDERVAVRAGEALDVCRMVINQPNIGSSGTFDNALTHTLSLGGGTWAGNQLEENLSAEQFIQTTRVAFPHDGDEPSAAAVFGPYEGFDEHK